MPVVDMQLVAASPQEIDARIREALAIAITPEPWDSTDEIGCPWWTAKRPDGAVIAAYVGVGLILIEPCGPTWSVGWTVAGPNAPGADERRAWLRAAIAALAGPDAIVVDGARVMRERGQA